MNKKITKYIILIIIISFIGYCIYELETKKPFTEYVYCGTILKHSSDEVTIKHGVKTELYLLVRFDNLNITKAIEVSPTTYFNNKDGDNVCFTLEKQTLYPELKTIYTGLGMLFYFISSVLLICVIIALLITWLF